MATTAEYLTQLQTDKTTLVTNLVAKGVDATNDETFTTLVPKVADIQGGGKYAPRYISFYGYSGTELNEEIANLDTSNITSMNNMFYSCSQLTTLDLSSFNTSNANDMHHMFASCIHLTTLDLTSFDTSNVNNMSYMFNSCQKLTDLDLSSFDTSKVTDMSSMLYYCSQLTTLDLTSFDTSKVTDMSSMFYSCQKLSNIPKLNASKVIYVTSFAGNCKSLTDFGGLENLGQAYSTSYSANYYSYKLDLSTCTALTEQSLINVLTNLYDIATKGCKTQQVILGSTNLAKLVSEEGQQALASSTEKGWSIS